MEHQQTPPKQRRYLFVVPSENEAIFPLSPPPVAMPWGLGRAQANMYQHKVGEAWLLDEQEGQPDVLSKRANALRKNDYYMEHPFESYDTLFVFLFFAYVFLLAVLFGFILDAPSMYYYGLSVLITIFLMMLIPSSYLKYPTIIFNRLRGDIYIYDYEKKSIMLKKFSTSTFFFSESSSTGGLCLLCEEGSDITDRENSFCIDAGRGISPMIPAWENIRRYMEPGDGYKEVPVRKNKLWFLPFMGLAMRLDEQYFSPPHRWPPEIEMLLWPENKDAPLPHGWRYDTWIPYDIPKGGFDNTELLSRREERLQAAKSAPANASASPEHEHEADMSKEQ